MGSRLTLPPPGSECTNRDIPQAYILHREHVAADQANSTDLVLAQMVAPEMRVALEKTRSLIDLSGCQRFKVRIFGDVAAGTCVLWAVSWPKRPESPSMTAESTALAPKGNLLGKFTTTIGTDRTDGVHPIDPYATYQGPYFEAKTVTVAETGDDKDSNWVLFAAGGNNRQARISVDPDGDEVLYIFATTYAASLAKLDIGVQLGA